MAKKTPKQVKPKTGLARCMELASNKKGLIFISAILSSLASIASFIPYIAVYFIIRSILQVYPNLNSLDVNEVIGYGWLALGGIIANILLYFLAMAATPMGALPMMVWPSRRPSPVITMSASLMQDSNLVSSRTIWMPDWRMAFV